VIVATAALDDIGSNTDSGFKTFDLLAPQGTSFSRITFVPLDFTDGFDFAIDTLAFNQSIDQAIGNEPPAAVPLPAAMWQSLLTATLVGGAILLRRRYTATV
jgi:hypothetical protein